MRVNLIDNRELAVAVCQPAGDLWYDWATFTFETPFNQAKHLLPLLPLEPSPSAVSALVTADLGTSMLKMADCITLVFTTSPLAILDPRSLVRPMAAPWTFGWLF